MDGPGLRVRVQAQLTAAIVVSNAAGAAIVFALVGELVLGPDESTRVSTAAVVGYVLVAIAVGVVAGTRKALGRFRWLFDDRPPTSDEQRLALRVPLLLFEVQALLWLGAAVLFGAIDATSEPVRGLQVGLTVALSGLVTCTVAYYLSELALRPVAALALAADPPDRLLVPGAMTRSLVTWAVGSGAPVIGVVFATVFALGDDSISTARLAVIVIVLSAVAVVVGFALTALAARSLVDPIGEVQAALAEVSAGDLDAEVAVYDGTELGLLQAGFNTMVAGLREREQLRDLFGRHVGEAVVEEALANDARLGGETRFVAVLFVDVIGSTELASRRPAGEVVRCLNDFFGVVVDVVVAHGGLVNKFIGDAALAVWGAPLEVDDPAGLALASARELAARLPAEVPELGAGIGVTAGRAVAGNVGDERRYEYTVIGDPVNEAARLTELAKNAPGRVLASLSAVDAASDRSESERWEAGDEVVLRGRSAPTTLAHPRSG
jgi:adenylate cyclase